MAYAFRTLIVPAAHRDFASTLASTLGAGAGDNMFTTPLSPTGQEPATHYVSTGYISSDLAELLPLDTYVTTTDIQTGQQTTTHTRTDGNAAELSARALSAEFVVPPEYVTALFDAADVTEQEPFVAFARMGLTILQTPFAGQ